MLTVAVTGVVLSSAVILTPLTRQAWTEQWLVPVLTLALLVMYVPMSLMISQFANRPLAVAGRDTTMSLPVSGVAGSGVAALVDAHPIIRTEGTADISAGFPAAGVSATT